MVLLGHRADERRPGIGLVDELTAPRAGERIDLDAPVVVAGPPFAGEELPLLEAVERRVERALLDLKGAVGDLLDARENPVTVQLAERDGAEDEQIESAGDDGDAFGHGGVT